MFRSIRKGHARTRIALLGTTILDVALPQRPVSALGLSAPALLLVTAMAAAQTLSVTPVNIFLGAGQNSTSISVKNSGAIDASYQIRAFLWDQKDGTDETLDTDDIIVSPPLGTIAPNGQQIVRLLLRKPPVKRKSTYRIFLDKNSPSRKAGRGSGCTSGIDPDLRAPHHPDRAACAVARRKRRRQDLPRRGE